MKETKRESPYLIAKRAFLSVRSVTLLVTASIIFFFCPQITLMYAVHPALLLPGTKDP